MVTPIQRIPRYLLLLKDLLNHTPANHPDHPKLCIVLPKMEEVANYINNEKSKFDDITTILNLSQVISGYDDVRLQLRLSLRRYSPNVRFFSPSSSQGASSSRRAT